MERGVFPVRLVCIRQQRETRANFQRYFWFPDKPQRLHSSFELLVSPCLVGTDVIGREAPVLSPGRFLNIANPPSTASH